MARRSCLRAYGSARVRAVTGMAALLGVTGAIIGSPAAMADQTVDTTGCPGPNGFLSISYPPQNVAQQLGNTFVVPASPAPTSQLHTVGANVAGGPQGVTVALYNANASGPVGQPLWTKAATIDTSAVNGGYTVQMFTVDQPVTPGGTYMLAIISGASSTDARWLTTSGCAGGAAFAGLAGGAWGPAFTTLSFVADFRSPPVFSPSPVTFPSQPADTIGDTQTITVTAPDTTASLGQVRVAGPDAGDFIVVADQCSDVTLAPAASCTVGLRFAPQAAGASAARGAALSVAYAFGTTPPGWSGTASSGTLSDSLSGTAQPAQAGPAGPTGPAGLIGPAGPQGPAGKQGPAGQIELVICRPVTKTIKRRGRHRPATTQVCTAKLVSGAVSFTTSTAGTANLSRAGVVYAAGTVHGLRVTLTARRPLRAGRYTLALVNRDGRRVRRQVTIG